MNNNIGDIKGSCTRRSVLACITLYKGHSRNGRF